MIHLNKLILFQMLLLSASICRAQSFQVGHRQQNFTDPSRNNRNIPAEIYYPSNTQGNNVAIAQGQFPVLVFGHGFLMTWSAYEVEWNTLVPNGYIMVFPKTEGSMSPSHSDFGKDIAFLVGAMKAEGTKPSSPFFGAVASTSAVMGHSMGGGAAFLSVQYDSTITALATMAAAVTNPSSVTAAETITIPSLVIAGGNDCVTPPVQHQIPLYNALASWCKTYIEINGGSHCQFAGYNFFCSAGEATCSPPPSVSASEQQSITFSLLVPWLNYFLKGDTASGIQFQNLLAAATGITSQQNCSLVNTGITGYNRIRRLSANPNPFSDSTLLTAGEYLSDATVVIYNAAGAEMRRLNGLSGNEFRIYRDHLAAGTYYIRLLENSQLFGWVKIVIRN